MRPAVSFFSMTLISRVFGYIRDAVIMIFFGAGGLTDAFLVAFRLPNFLRRLFAEGAFSQAFVPVLAEYQKQNPAEMQTFINCAAGSLGAVLLVLSALGMIGAPLLILVIAPGFSNDAAQITLSADLLRIMFPYIIFVSLTALIAGILNVYGYFAIPALTPALLNLSLIAATLWLAPIMQQPITALAWGVLIAGSAQLLLQWVTLKRIGLHFKLIWGFYNDGVRRVLRLMLPTVLGASVIQINLLIDTIIASFLAAGSISWLYISERFVGLPIGLFGVAIATVLLTRLSTHFSTDNRSAFCEALSWGSSIGWLLAMPCVVGLTALAEPILISLVQYRAFSADDTAMARLSLIAYATGLPAFILVKILNAGFFSRQNTRLPVRTALSAMAANLIMNLLFVWLWKKSGQPGAHAGLALATSLASWLNYALLYHALKKEGYQIILPQSLLAKAVIACAIMGFVLLGLLSVTPSWNDAMAVQRLSALGGLMLIGFVVYVLTLRLFGIRARQLTAIGKISRESSNG